MADMDQKRAAKIFVERWQAEEGNEDRQSRSFWIELAQDLMGISNPTHVLDFERKVRGRKIDVFYEDMGVLIEQKSRGVDLDKKTERSKKAGEETPYQQAKWYADNLPYSVRPRWIVVSNFDEFRIHDLDTEDPEHDYTSVTLNELPDHLHLFGFLTDKSASRLVKEKELSVKAGEIVGRLYKSLAAQYQNIDTDPAEQRSLNILIVRFVFLLYAEDAGILQEHQAFLNYMRNVDPENMRTALMQLFEVLDTPEDERDPYLNEKLAAFPYINGSLFAKADIIIPQFTQQIKFDLLKEASQEFDWSGISPTIFGAAFESTLNPETRRAGGMHYTSIENIHKVIDPLFLDELKAELAEIEGERVEKTRNLKLRQFQNKLASIKILDPACGSGNFLTESYLSLRKLENRVLESLQGNQMGLGFAGEANPIKVSIDQFYGIEINDFAVAVAKTALWIAEEQTMDITQEILVMPLQFLPLTSNKNIIQANALRYDWNDLLPATECDYVIGNPPFLGGMQMNREQKQEIRDVFPEDIRNVGELDYVTAWYVKAANYARGTAIRCALVSTNSITQGLAVGTFWHLMKEELGCDIDFAYRTFVWDSEASDKAHVHVVIIGFSDGGQNEVKTIFGNDGETVFAKNINGYLMDADDAYVFEVSEPLSDVPSIRFGSMPRAKGFTLAAEDREMFIEENPISEKWIRPYWGAEEFLNRKERYCLWLVDADDAEIAECPCVQSRVNQVREERASSKAAATRKLAATPKLFAQIAQPEGEGHYLLIPGVSSEKRDYIPIAFVPNEVIASNLAYVLPDSKLYHFGVLSSQFHNAWMRTVAGRLKSDYRYAKDLVYNTFIWPDAGESRKEKIEECAQKILDIRDFYSNQKIGDLYKRDKMPSDLLAVHKALDKAVEEAYGVDFNGDEEKIAAYLFKLYLDTTERE